MLDDYLKICMYAQCNLKQIYWLFVLASGHSLKKNAIAYLLMSYTVIEVCSNKTWLLSFPILVVNVIWFLLS